MGESSNGIKMLPVALKLSNLKIILVGVGQPLTRRIEMLQKAGANNVVIYTTGTEDYKSHKINWPILQGLPKEEDIQGKHILLVAGISDKIAFPLADMARQCGLMINVEDRPDYCDFYYSAIVRRGDLLIGVNTSGKSPVLTVRIKKLLESIFTPDWADKLTELASLRNSMRSKGMAIEEIIKETNRYIDEKQWFSDQIYPRHRGE